MIKQFVLLSLVAALLTGCAHTRQSEPKRTAVEQLLLSRAADVALARADFGLLKDKRVYVEEKYFDATDGKYALGAVRDFISLSGGLLVDAAADSDVIIEARSGGLSIDSGDSLVGIPEVPFPIPAAGTLVTPEAPLYKVNRQYSIAKLALLAYETKSRKHLYSTGTLIGKSHHHNYRILGFFNWVDTELPEKQRGN